MGRALVLGCGGTLGFAWTATVLAELERQGWDPRTADVIIGTSAGAEAAAMLGAGISAQVVLASLRERPGGDRRVTAHLHSPLAPGGRPGVPRPWLPGVGITRSALLRRTDLLSGAAGLLPRGSGDAAWLVDLGSSLQSPTGWVDHPATWLVATDARSGRRVALGGPRAPKPPLGRAIAASWAIPGWFPPVKVDGRPLLDGGVISPTSADLLLPAVGRGEVDEVVVVAPMATFGGAPATGLARAERLLRRPMTRRLDGEVHDLRAAGAHVRRIEPTQQDLDAMGANFMDARRRPRVLATAAHTAPALVARRLDGEAVLR
ncbi:MAG TPA: patatin-like phospholipase family protein [Nocardioides sp.]|nr:patatin-like phospholipase family protein [Nocardioides sp.]